MNLIAATKKCSFCHQRLLLDRFNTSRRDGLQPICRDCSNAYNRQRYSAKQAYYSVRDAARNAAKYDVESTLTEDEWQAKLEDRGYHCIFCEEPFTDMHHLVPLGAGGANVIENVEPVCEKHHSDAHMAIRKQPLYLSYVRTSVMFGIVPNSLTAPVPTEWYTQALSDPEASNVYRIAC